MSHHFLLQGKGEKKINSDEPTEEQPLLNIKIMHSLYFSKKELYEIEECTSGEADNINIASSRPMSSTIGFALIIVVSIAVILTKIFV